MFISRSSLWTHFDCKNADKTRVYLERSKSSPIDLWIRRDRGLSPDDPFFEIDPCAIRRLKSLAIYGISESLQDITARLSHPAPSLKQLSIDGQYGFGPHRDWMLTTALFNGDLSSLRTLHLERVRTELPWRNMANLTSFTLWNTPPGGFTIDQLLDFFESAPRLREIFLYLATPSSGGQNGRLVSLVCLKGMIIVGDEPSSLLLDHLLIPVGAKLTTRVEVDESEVDPLDPILEDHLPRSLDNLRNLAGFTKIRLHIREPYTRMNFSGPNGQLCAMPATSRVNATRLVLESLARFDTSETERLEIDRGSALSRDHLYRALLPMKNLRMLTLYRCRKPQIFLDALHPDTGPPNVLVCPELEELAFDIRRSGREFDIDSVIEMAAARALSGKELTRVRIVDHRDILDPVYISELREHVQNVEYGPGVIAFDDSSDVNDEEE